MENLSILESEWYILNEMLGDLKSRKIEVPMSVVENLRYTRFIIMHYKESTEGKTHKHEDYFMDLEVTLNNVKAALLSRAQELGEKYVAMWKKKIDEAPLRPPPQRKKTFVKGVSRDSGLDFVRIRFDKIIPESELMRIAKRYNINIELGEEKVAIVSGRRENVKKALQAIAKNISKF